MKYFKKYVQFNNVVFDDTEMVREYDAINISTKTQNYEYSHDHGAYVAFKRKGSQLIKPITVSMTMVINPKKVACEQREPYLYYVKQELMKPGVLWCVQGSMMLYAFAYVDNVVELVVKREDYVEVDLNFVLYEGYFHKADTKSTFFIRYDNCNPVEHLAQPDYMEQFKSVCDCTACEKIEEHEDLDKCNCQDCDNERLSLDDQLEYNRNWLDKFYDLDCTLLNRKIVYNTSFDKTRGYYFHSKDSCHSKISETFNSNTVLDTSFVGIEISGKCLNDVAITINGNTNVIAGEYSGTLIVKEDGSIYNGCEKLPVSAWKVPQYQDYGWLVHNGKNTLLIEGCSYMKVRVFVDELYF